MGYRPVLTEFRPSHREAGQAIIMVTLALIAMCGVLGLAVDFGWAYFVKRAAQSAADMAAVTAVEEMRRITGYSAAAYPCLSGCDVDIACDSNIPVDTTDAENLDNACKYALRAGFQEGGAQSVRITEGSIADGNGIPPTLSGGGFPLQYWATVRVTETVPQLFSALTGNPMATVSASATAGLYLGKTRGSIILTNRNEDVPQFQGGNFTGINLQLFGTADVVAGGGILMASSCNGECGPGNNGNYSGDPGGANSTVRAPFTHIRQAGGIKPGGAADQWLETPMRNVGDGPQFRDPTENLPQIPADNSALAECQIPLGLIGGDGQTFYVGPGNYYATKIDSKTGETVATADPIVLAGNVVFTNSGNCVHQNGASNPATFGTHVLFGGVKMNPGADVLFDPGKVIIAGVQPAGSGAGSIFDITVGGSAASLRTTDATAAGNVFISTSPHSQYPELYTPTLLKSAKLFGDLKQGRFEFKSGNNGNVDINLQGLNPKALGFPESLKKYESVVLWQDRNNSRVAYTAEGKYACAPPYVDSSCYKANGEDGQYSDSPGLSIDAGAMTGFHGTMYQPRGGWAEITAASDVNSALQLITGSLRVGGNGTVTLLPVTSALPRSIVSLVQ